MNNNRDGICGLLATSPPNYRVNEIVVDGFNEDVFRFINLEEDTHLAYFREEDGGLVVADCRRISLVDFPA
ncbi:hypothetical protein [Psychrobacillus sp. FSL K6-1464]|uniref:hypothetical protein n=1 Tax=Psychrobacillus sp. FSL K6-1464 TaxID=2921545 RepID=UPI0030F6D16B